LSTGSPGQNIAAINAGILTTIREKKALEINLLTVYMEKSGKTVCTKRRKNTYFCFFLYLVTIKSLTNAAAKITEINSKAYRGRQSSFAQKGKSSRHDNDRISCKINSLIAPVRQGKKKARS
jgi:hypothetical protein